MAKKRTRKNEAPKGDKALAGWLLERNRRTRTRRVKVLSWSRLAVMYFDARPGSAVRRLITNEARRCGYTPRVVLALNHPESAVS